MAERQYRIDRWEPWLVHAITIAILAAGYLVVTQIPSRYWALFVFFGSMVLGLAGSIWIDARGYFTRVVVDAESISVRGRYGRQRVRWADVDLVRSDDAARSLSLHRGGEVLRVTLDRRANADALLETIRARVRPAAWQVSALAVAVSPHMLPKLTCAADPIGVVGYREAGRPGRVVPVSSLRPDVSAWSWATLGPSLLYVLLRSGRGAAWSLLAHANAAVYWRRVALVFGDEVRLERDGFVSLDGRYRYRATPGELAVRWERLDPETGSVVETYLLRRPGAALGELIVPPDQPTFMGLPAWLGGKPRWLPPPPPDPDPPLTETWRRYHDLIGDEWEKPAAAMKVEPEASTDDGGEAALGALAPTLEEWLRGRANDDADVFAA